MRQAVKACCGGVAVVLLGASGAYTATPCSSPFFPVGDGSRWTYAETMSLSEVNGPRTQQTSTVVVIRRVSSARSVSETIALSDGLATRTTRAEWTCTPEGMRAPNWVSPYAPETSGGNWQFEGVDVPPADRWRVGESWASTTRRPSNGSTPAVTGRSTYRVIAEEQVTVPSGTYDGFKVEVSQLIEVGTGPAVLAAKGTTWYARDVGLVKSLGSATMRPPAEGERPAAVHTVRKTSELTAYAVGR